MLPGGDEAELEVEGDGDVVGFGEVVEFAGFWGAEGGGFFEEDVFTSEDGLFGHGVVGEGWCGDGDGLGLGDGFFDTIDAYGDTGLGGEGLGFGQIAVVEGGNLGGCEGLEGGEVDFLAEVAAEEGDGGGGDGHGGMGFCQKGLYDCL